MVKCLSIFAWLILTTIAASASSGLCVQHLISPGYPRLARIAQLEGAVTVKAELGSDGTVASVISAGGDSGNKFLLDVSRDNLRQWLFCKADPSQTKSDREISITYVYKLNGKPAYYEPPAEVVFDLPDRIEITSRPYDPQY